MSTTGSGALAVRRSYPVDNENLAGVVVEVDATEEPRALAVLQARLHETPAGTRLIFGYDLAPSGLGAWIGDRRMRLRVWPALVHDDGSIEADEPDGSGDATGELLMVDFDPEVDAEALARLSETGRLIIAGPEAGPVPLVLEIDLEALAEVLAEISGLPGTA